MNHIQCLQLDLKVAEQKLKAMEQAIVAFRVHLQSSKFQNSETEQKDWIATADVHRWLDNIQNAE